MILEVLREYEKRGVRFRRFCCIYPTAPFLTADRLREAMALLDTAESVMPVVAFSYPPQRGLIVENGCVRRKYPQYQNTRSQDLEKMYHDCGQFYACRTDAFLRDGTTDVEDLVPVYLSDLEVQDIDTEEDWEIAELKYRRLPSDGFCRDIISAAAAGRICRDLSARPRRPQESNNQERKLSCSH